MSQVETTSAGVLPSRAPSWMNKSHCKRHKSKGKTLNTEQMDSLHFAVKNSTAGHNSKGVRHLNYTATLSSSVALSTHTRTGLFCSSSIKRVKNFERKTQRNKTLR